MASRNNGLSPAAARDQKKGVRIVAGALNPGPGPAAHVRNTSGKGPTNKKPTAGFSLKAQNASFKQQRVGNGRAGKK